MTDKCVLIVGGTGSWSRGLIESLLEKGVGKIKVFARNEAQMVSMLREAASNKLEPVIGDIRDSRALSNACKDCDTVFHMAALKHVPICEKMPEEAILTNVIGTQNVIDCAIENKVCNVIYVSTDKAVDPGSTYGCTKLLGEKLIISANEQSRNTKFIVFRGGNLLGSTGSVIPFFKKQIEEKGQITLTDRRMNRFFISIKKASELLIEAAIRGAGGEIFIPTMPAICIEDIAKYLLEQKSLALGSIKIVGIRPGEKLNEQLITQEESEYIYEMTKELSLLMKDDSHGWIANGFVKRNSNYVSKSEEALVPYEEAKKILKLAEI